MYVRGEITAVEIHNITYQYQAHIPRTGAKLQLVISWKILKPNGYIIIQQNTFVFSKTRNKFRLRFSVKRFCMIAVMP
ncbi:unnamed protein product [Clavelina lepadiformis]|uniref:Uncharacterized protein n=1 Tax=Clavelina lepadiformis TaxID=159417 RepID=A0ABP0F1Q3_CLALP